MMDDAVNAYFILYLLFLFIYISKWGEEMYLNEGDFLVTTYPLDGKNEVYRIEESAMSDTYKPIMP